MKSQSTTIIFLNLVKISNMNDINLSRIYTHLMRFYSISRFKVFSVLDEKGRYPIETKFDFYLDNTREVNHASLQRVLKRNIKNVNDFFFVVQDNRIIIYVDFTNKKNHLEFDFEFSSN